MGIEQPFEQYRLIVEETSRIREARHNLGNLFLSVNAIFVGAVAVILQQSTQATQTQPIPRFVILLPVLLVGAGLVLCVCWLLLLRNYRNLLGFRFAYLTKIEADYKDRLIPLLTDQTAHLRKHRIPGFTAVESFMPFVFILTYLGIIAVLAFGLGFPGNVSGGLPH